MKVRSLNFLITGKTFLQNTKRVKKRWIGYLVGKYNQYHSSFIFKSLCIHDRRASFFFLKSWFIYCGCMFCFKIDLKVYLGIPFSYLSYNQHCDGLDECEDKNLTQGCHFHFLIDLPTVAVSSIHLFWSTFSSTFDYHCLFPCSRLVFNLKTFPKLS